MKPTLLLVEDHRLVSEGLKAMLSANYAVLAIVGDGALVLEAVARYRPDILLLDLSLPNRTGIDLLPDLRRTYPDLRVIVVTMHTEGTLAEMALKLGASGFVAKNTGITELHAAIEEVFAGRRYVSPGLMRRSNRSRATDRIGFERLTPHQQRIVRLISKGMTSQQIGASLGVSSWTVHFHRKNIRQKLGVHSDFEMRRYAMLIDLAEEDQPRNFDAPEPGAE